MDLSLEPDDRLLPALGPGEVHVWYFSLSGPRDQIEANHGLLDAQEQARAARFFRSIHRDRFAMGRGTLRRLLARYTDTAPEALTFTYGDAGKPALPGNSNPAELRFNLSHSGDQAVCAIAREMVLGVDLERCRENRELLGIARRFFSPEELRQLIALPPEAQLAAFYQCWTGKEALIKAWGRGLSTPLDRYTVRVSPSDTALLSLDLPEYSGQDWRVCAIPAPPRYAASLASRGPIAAIRIAGLQRFLPNGIDGHN